MNYNKSKFLNFLERDEREAMLVLLTTRIQNSIKMKLSSSIRRRASLSDRANSMPISEQGSTVALDAFGKKDDLEKNEGSLHSESPSEDPLTER